MEIKCLTVIYPYNRFERSLYPAVGKYQGQLVACILSGAQSEPVHHYLFWIALLYILLLTVSAVIQI